ncbi:UbiD family decarboxylase [Roseomonas sp. NAR14]|uniref:Pyrrole-2-carboxylic acid decarboxylase n=1 Tax=Roseomonas acroporae TaxID=2937791 RepID=A0A9X1YEA9_9PROT|nr:UbiD family decarboxylase [Roseomonas acroporae]MCK8787568.1 UbiD family decarboxylase [Roseomonas acroporae]
MRPVNDLRHYIALLRELGEIQDIDVPVALDLELGAIIRRCYETGAPAPLFGAYSDHPGGFRILGAPAGTSRQPGMRLARIAVSLGLAPRSSGQDILEAVVASLDLPGIRPVVVDDAPCFENVATGEAVDLDRLPVPLLHAGDGGRYLNTYGCIVARTPDGAWTNWSIARMMLVDGHRLSGIVAPQQHVGMVARAWADIGKPMPFALALGVEPGIPFVCGMPLPAHVDEADRLGALLNRPVPTVRCRTVALEAPASAEILIEGHLHLDETVPEGPMGEFAGYLWPGTPAPRPVYRVTAISHRDDAILPVVVAGEPAEENHTVWGVMSAAQILHQLRQAGLPVTFAWAPLEAVLHWVVVTVPRDWRRRSGAGDSEEFCRRIGEAVFHSKAGATTPKIIVLNDDIDPTDLKELVWAFATRCHPTVGNVPFNGEDTAPLIAYLRQDEKLSGTSAKMVYNGLPPDEWGEALPVRASFRHGYPHAVVDRVLKRWHEYGFVE